jgi:hypothetical protein
MEPRVTAILTNAQGWQKRVPLDVGLHWIGTAPGCTIRLTDGENIAPYHVQIVNNANEAHIRLVNLSGQALILERNGQNEIVAERSMQDIFANEVLHLGTFTLQFDIHKQYVPHTVAHEKNQHILGLRLVLSSHVLQPGTMIHGRLYLRNLGDQPCQFDVDLEGLPRENYEIDPPPLIHPGGEESSDLRIYHRLISPAAGNVLLTLRVGAPAVYPGRELMIQQTIRVLPNYQFLASWQADEPAADPLDNLHFNLPQSVTDLPLASNIPPVEPQAEEPEVVAEETPSAQPAEQDRVEEVPSEIPVPQHGQKRPNLSGVRVVRGSSGDFLDELGRQS